MSIFIFIFCDGKRIVLDKISSEQREKLLKYFSHQTVISGNEIRIPESNKPLWVNSVKKICREIIPKIDIKEVTEYIIIARIR
jgi:hypothetical protein